MELSEQQRADLATLLAESVPRPNIATLAVSVLGREVLAAAGNEVSDTAGFAARIVELLDEAGRTAEFIDVLREDLHRDGRLATRLNHVLGGGRLDDAEALQRLVNMQEPFFNTAEFEAELLPRLRRTVCAIGRGAPHNDIVGSGFLIAPDLVLTNFHVVDAFVGLRDGRWRSKPDTEVFCIFDYRMAPAPNLPPDDSAARRCLCVRGATDWLEYGREPLADDGTDKAAQDVGSRYDYAVIRLERPVGTQPARRSSARPRGWLPLPTQIDVHAPPEGGRRVLLFGHPQKLPQNFDVGTYVGLDLSGTRVRYSVSAARGSSGGPAVDSKGRLFALHNAEVTQNGAVAVAAGTAGLKLNQGIRIDRIAQDLTAGAPELVSELTNAGDPAVDARFWSLSDDPADPQPVIGRSRFRANVGAMRAPEGGRVMVVTGPEGSGVRFSIRLLRRTLGAQIPVVVFKPGDLQRLSPKDFLRVLVDELGLLNVAQIPEPKPTEQLSRWLRMDLPVWLAERLAEDQKDPRRKLRYPAWVVINTVTADDERLLWADQLKDFVAALAGVRDAGQSGTDIPHLRWLFLARRPDALPIPGGALQDEDLSRYESWETDFSECLAMAWLTVEKDAELSPLLHQLLARDFFNKAQAEHVPLRQALAEGVRKLIVGARAIAAPGGGR